MKLCIVRIVTKVYKNYLLNLFYALHRVIVLGILGDVKINQRSCPQRKH